MAANQGGGGGGVDFDGGKRQVVVMELGFVFVCFGGLRKYLSETNIQILF